MNTSREDQANLLEQNRILHAQARRDAIDYGDLSPRRERSHGTNEFGDYWEE